LEISERVKEKYVHQNHEVGNRSNCRHCPLRELRLFDEQLIARRAKLVHTNFHSGRRAGSGAGTSAGTSAGTITDRDSPCGRHHQSEPCAVQRRAHHGLGRLRRIAEYVVL
jgi:hypothetical protein